MRGFGVVRGLVSTTKRLRFEWSPSLAVVAMGQRGAIFGELGDVRAAASQLSLRRYGGGSACYFD